MRRLTGVFIALLMICAFCLLSVDSFAETGKPPKTVVDFYLLLPKDAVQAFEDDSTTQKQRLKLLHYLGSFADIPHGYLELHGDCDSSFVVCLFRKTDGSYLVASYFGGSEDDDIPELNFFEYSAGHLVKAKSPLPVPFNKNSTTHCRELARQLTSLMRMINWFIHWNGTERALFRSAVNVEMIVEALAEV